MAETAIAAVLSKLGELATRGAALLLKVGDDIMLLRDRLEWLQAFIGDADRKRLVGGDVLTRVWVRQTRDVAFEAEDTLDDFFHKVDLVSQNFGGWKKVHGCFTRFRTQITVRHGLSGRIQRIKSRLDQISENQKEYKIDHQPPGMWTSSTTALAPWDDLKKVVGFDKDKETVRNLLLRDQEHLHRMFISILGESGVGKRTLTKEIWKDGNEIKKFQVYFWYDMPPGSSMDDILEEVYKRAYKAIHKRTEGPSATGIDIVDKLRDLLTNKRYLVILGGLSSKTILNCVVSGFPEDKNGSRVILILDPECEEVARHADTLNQLDVTTIHRLSRLDDETSGWLFRTRVYGAKVEDAKDITKMKIYEKYVYDITEGHPLAIVVLAGLLRYKEKPVEWDAVLQHLRPGMEEGEDGQDNPVTGLLLFKEKPAQWMAPPTETKLSNRMVIQRIFSASFDDLPQDLKSCFLYFAASAKNVSLSPDQIVRMWTAEGFIKPQEGRSLEELGHSYIKELVSRCLVELISKNGRGGINTVIVHNRLLEFLQSEARESSFIEVHDGNDILAPASVRRLSIQNDSGTFNTFTNKFPKLRSFICRVATESESSDKPGGEIKKERREITCGPMLSCVISSPVRDGERGCCPVPWRRHDLKFLCGSKFLRLISVQGLRLEELPDEIGDMIHLRYLRVDCPSLKSLPRSIRRLLNLQTLDIRHTGVEEIDPYFWKIRTLRHVLAGKLTLRMPVLKKEELGELQTLHGVRADGKWVAGSSPLDKMAKLVSLELHGFVADIHGSAFERAVSNMHLLGHLKLEGDVIPASCLFTGPVLRCLQSMELEFPAKCPDIKWDDLRKVRPNLVELRLINITDVPPMQKDGMRNKLSVSYE